MSVPPSIRCAGNWRANKSGERADEHVEAVLEPEDLDVRSPAPFPARTPQTEADGATPPLRVGGPAPRRSPRTPPPARWRGRTRCPRRPAERLFRAQPGEGQVQDGLPHLAPRPFPWWARPSHDPVSTDRTAGKCSARSSWTPTGPRRRRPAGEGPVVRRPTCPVPPPELGGLPGPRRGLDLGPGHEERHGPRLVDAAVDEPDQAAELVLAGQTQLEAGRPHDEVEEGPERWSAPPPPRLSPRVGRRRTRRAGRRTPHPASPSP